MSADPRDAGTGSTARAWTGEAADAYYAGWTAGIADEREACAQLAEQHHAYVIEGSITDHGGTVIYQPFADLIRARTTEGTTT